MSTTELDPKDRQGPKAPTSGTPPRVPGSIRRTTVLDGLHPDGAGGPHELQLSARDLKTTLDGEGVEIAAASVEMLVDRKGAILRVQSRPEEPRLQELVGSNPRAGWRRRIGTLLPDDGERRTLLYLLLDSVSAWMALSSFGVVDMPKPVASAKDPRPRRGQDFDGASRADICAGWQQGGTLLQLTAAGNLGGDFLRPPAPTLETDQDPLAWHRVEALRPFGARRRRRVDVIPGDPLVVDAMFRDSSADQNGGEGVLHEYTVSASVDPRSLLVINAGAVPRSLPYEECPQAAGSASQLIGNDVRDMRIFVGKEMRGPTTCTHLNELYRTFGDLGSLAALL